MSWLRITILNLKIFSADKAAVFWLVLMPLIFVYVFGMAFRPRENTTTSISIADYDGGRLAKILVDELEAPGFFIERLKPDDRDNIENKWRTLVIPKGFTDEVLAGNELELYFVVQNEGMNNTYDLAAAVHLVETLGRLIPGMVRVQLIDNLANGYDAWGDLEAELDREMPLSVEVRSASNVDVTPLGFAFTSVSYLILFVLINTLIFGGVTLAEERTGGQLRRLAISPASRTQILFGMIMARWILGMLQVLVLIGATYYLFSVNWGRNPVGLILMTMVFTFSCAAMGILIGSWVSRSEQAILIGVVGGNLMGGLGGCWWPKEMMPEGMRMVGFFFPTGWAVQGMHKVVSWGKATSAVMPELFVILLFGVVSLAIAVRILKWE